MLSYGPLVRKIRLSKGISQKEVYSGITSRSFYSKFESGEHSVEAFKFKLFLENINISFSEFFLLHDKENPANRNASISAIINIYYDFNLHTIDKLLKIYADNKISDSGSDRLIGSAAYALVWSLKPEINPRPLYTLKEYFIRLEFFSLMELELFITTFFIFLDDDEQITEQLISKSISSIKIWWPLNPDLLDRLIGSLYVNIIQFLIAKNKIEEASLLDQRLIEAFDSSKISLTTQLYFTFFKSFLEKDLKKVEFILRTIKEYDRQTYNLLKKIVESTTLEKLSNNRKNNI